MSRRLTALPGLGGRRGLPRLAAHLQGAPRRMASAGDGNPDSWQNQPDFHKEGTVASLDLASVPTHPPPPIAGVQLYRGRLQSGSPGAQDWPQPSTHPRTWVFRGPRGAPRLSTLGGWGRPAFCVPTIKFTAQFTVKCHNQVQESFFLKIIFFISKVMSIFICKKRKKKPSAERESFYPAWQREKF